MFNEPGGRLHLGIAQAGIAKGDIDSLFTSSGSIPMKLRSLILLMTFANAFLMNASASAQERESPTIEAANKSTILPAQWLGRWESDVQNQTAGGTNQTFRMSLEIQPTDSAGQLSWTITYDGAQGKSERPYRLVAVDAAKGQFIIDEQNGIRLDAVLLDNCLSSHFVVGGQRLWSTYRLQSTEAGPEIQFELMTADDTAVTKSGGKDGVPEVTSLKTHSRQVATLRPVKNEAATGTSDLPAWTKLKTEPYRGKQDDIFFINPDIGWYVNGTGKIFKTTNGGDSWVQQLHKPGTYFRCIAFVDEKLGFAGNIGPDYFPNVSDKTPLYQTTDGGETWTEVTTIEGPPIVGLCAMQVLQEKFVNAGQLDERTRIIGIGRVGGPTAMIVSDDLGKTWQQISIAEHAAMAFDVHFFNRNEGIIAAATNADVAQSNGLILSTSDGGKTWTKPWKSERPFELTWKISFPTREVGYITIQSYNPDPAVRDRFVAKTVDGGKTWSEVKLVSDAKVREFGIAFLDEQIGWVGAMPNGFQTTDGGTTWSKVDMGNAVNKIRVLKSPDSVTAFAIGTHVHRLTMPVANPAKE